MAGRGVEDQTHGKRRTLNAERAVAGILFDKDGTLLDFAATWGPATAGVLAELSAGDEDLHDRLARLAGFDRHGGVFHPDSPIIAGALDSFAPEWAAQLGVVYDADFFDRVNRMFREKSLLSLKAFAEVEEVLDALLVAGFSLGLATNDAEENARAHLDAMGITDRFSLVAGYDSGHGAKPGPGMVRAFAESIGVAPAQVAMVGDTLHDLDAARAAGAMGIVVVRTEADARRFEDHADIVIVELGPLLTHLRR